MRLVDVRPRAAYLAGHLPGAAHLDPEEDLTGTLGGGRHPLPDAEAFATSASRAGIAPGDFVLVLDDGTGWAARLWWLLRHYGHDAAGTLDVRAYCGPLAAGDEPAAPSRFVSRERGGDTISAGELRERLDDPSLLVLDARAPERWRGEVEPLDPVAGRIPGARNAYFEHDLPAGATDAPEVAVYCGSGVTACVQVHRLVLAGRDDARLYPGSWSDWITHPDYPQEQGEPA